MYFKSAHGDSILLLNIKKSNEWPGDEHTRFLSAVASGGSGGGWDSGSGRDAMSLKIFPSRDLKANVTK